MSVWLDLIRLQWLTGKDGRPAFWKLQHLANTATFTGTVYCACVTGLLVSALPWLFAWATLLILTGFGFKGAQLWAEKGKPNIDLTGNTDTKLTGDLAAIAKEVLQRRASSDHPGTEPSP